MDIKKNNTKFIIFEIIIIMLGIIGVTFAVSYVMKSINVNVNTAQLAVNYTGSLTLPTVNLTPINDSSVSTNTDNVMRVNFTVKGVSSNPNIPIIYDVILSELQVDTELKNEYLKWELEKNGVVISSGSFSPWFDSMKDGKLWLTEIQQDLPTSSESADSYEFRLWISESCTGDITTCTEDMDQSNMLNKTISGKIETVLYTKGKEALVRVPATPSEITLIKLGLSLSEGVPNFNKTAQAICGDESTCETTNGIYEAEDDFGTSYYFRGAVENNYVKFAGYYWRIIRINGDGTIRMIYDGTSAHANGESSADRQVSETAFNTNSNDNAYVGYMYGTPGSSTYNATHTNTNNSTIKTANDNWYKTNIVDKGYSNYVADAIYCNDRQVVSLPSFEFTGNGTGTQQTAYMAFSRLYIDFALGINVEPTLKCSQLNDMFTVSSNYGNRKLIYPVGLITADECFLAGGSIYSNNSFYLYSGYTYNTLTPSIAANANVWHLGNNGDVLYAEVLYNNYLRPVISLKSDIILAGNGTMSQPFEIVM